MSYEVFRVGDLVEILPGRCTPDAVRYIGREGVIVKLCSTYLKSGEPRHEIEMRDGGLLDAAERCLRKRRPPREQTSTWDDVIVWRPKATELTNG